MAKTWKVWTVIQECDDTCDEDEEGAEQRDIWFSEMDEFDNLDEAVVFADKATHTQR